MFVVSFTCLTFIFFPMFCISQFTATQITLAYLRIIHLLQLYPFVLNKPFYSQVVPCLHFGSCFCSFGLTHVVSPVSHGMLFCIGTSSACLIVCIVVARVKSAISCSQCESSLSRIPKTIQLRIFSSFVTPNCVLTINIGL